MNETYLVLPIVVWTPMLSGVNPGRPVFLTGTQPGVSLKVRNRILVTSNCEFLCRRRQHCVVERTVLVDFCLQFFLEDKILW